MGKLRIAASVSVLLATVIVVRPVFAAPDCSRAQSLVSRLRTQIASLTQEKADLDRSLNNLDTAEADGDVLFGQNSDKNATAQKNLEAQAAQLADICNLKGPHAEACSELVEVHRDQMKFEIAAAKNDNRNRTMHKGLKAAQGGRHKESLEIELSLRDAQDDLEKATQDLEECRGQTASTASSATPKKFVEQTKAPSSSGWNSF